MKSLKDEYLHPVYDELPFQAVKKRLIRISGCVAGRHRLWFLCMETPKESLSARFASVYGSPGEAPRVLGLLRAFWPLLVICFITGYLLRAWFPKPYMSVSTVGVLFFLVAVATAILLACDLPRPAGLL